MNIALEEELTNFFMNKNILVTGGTGSIGKEIVKMLLNYKPNKIIVFNKDDTKQYLMQQQFANVRNIEYLLGDIRDYDSVYKAMKNIDYVFHTAALKQVPVCEENPNEAIATNIHGSQNVIRASMQNQVKKVINISTDKVVHPTNIMGMTKLIAEKLFQYANDDKQNDATLFCSVRFGNVVGSRGSVIPLFLQKAKNGEPLTVTDQNMTRFIMSMEEAAKLTLFASYNCRGKETFIFKMKAIKIEQLVKAIQLYCHVKQLPVPKLVMIGPRRGEKMHEQLIAEEEKDFVFENEFLYVILPNGKTKNIHPHFQKANVSSLRSDEVPLLSDEELYQIVQKLGDR